MTLRSLFTAGISSAILAITMEGASLLRALGSFLAVPPAWLVFGALAGVAVAWSWPRRG